MCRVPLAAAETSVNICQLEADTGVVISRYLAFGGGWCWANGDTDKTTDTMMGEMYGDQRLHYGEEFIPEEDKL